MAAIGNATRHGFLVREGDALERLAQVRRVCFDKTGTLTTGEPQVVSVCAGEKDVSEDALLAVAGAAEKRSEHPLGRAIVAAATEHAGAAPKDPTSFAMVPGRGVVAEVGGRTVYAGSAGADERHDTYTGDLIAHYLSGMPAWVLLEVVDFGTFADFWLFCAERWGDERMRQQHYVLKSVKALRNACAHNSLLVHGLDAQDAPADFPTNRLLSDSLNGHGMKNTRTRRAKLKNLRVAQMAAALWSLDEFCARPSTRAREARRRAPPRPVR